MWRLWSCDQFHEVWHRRGEHTCLWRVLSRPGVSPVSVFCVATFISSRSLTGKRSPAESALKYLGTETHIISTRLSFTLFVLHLTSLLSEPIKCGVRWTFAQHLMRGISWILVCSSFLCLKFTNKLSKVKGHIVVYLTSVWVPIFVELRGSSFTCWCFFQKHVVTQKKFELPSYTG